MNRKCHFCGNKNFKKENVEYIYKLGEKFLLVNHVPCETCEYCGEQYFEATVLKKIEGNFHDIYFSGKRAKKEVVVPVEEFLDL